MDRRTVPPRQPGSTPARGSKQYNAMLKAKIPVVNLPDIGITGNSHFMFEEMNNKQIADNIEAWLIAHHLG